MIYTEEDLKVLQSESTTYRGGIWSRSKYYKLANSITLSGSSWTPLSESYPYFSGSFDGDGHTIMNLNITNATYPSLFGVVSGATIKNLTVSGSVSGSNYVAGIVSVSDYLSATTIESCHNGCTISGSGEYIGGVIAVANEAVLNQCYNTVPVTGNTSTGKYVGGVAGSSNAMIINSYNTATITGAEYVGGVVGCGSGASAIIVNSYNEGAVKGASSVYNNISGILGGTIYSVPVIACYNSGSICSGYGGAIVGSYDSIFGYCGVVENCYYLTNSASNLIYNTSSTISFALSSTTLQRYATTLTSYAKEYNETFAEDDYTSTKACKWTDSGYPTLSFDTVAE